MLAAGLSGLAQAVYLAGGIAQTTTAPVGLRFGVGAWPAIAAALTAHLLHLIGTVPAADQSDALTPTRQPPVKPASNPGGVQPFNPPAVQPSNPTAGPGTVRPPRTTNPLNAPAIQPDRSIPTAPEGPGEANRARSRSAGGGSPVTERARQAAHSHYARHGRLPTASELMQIAKVARGTAGTVLKDLRRDPPALHLTPPTPIRKPSNDQ